MTTATTPRARRRWAAAPAFGLAAVTLSAFGLTGCQGRPLPIGSQSAPLPPRTVELVNNSFIPHVMNISVGQSVTWSWLDVLSPANVYFPDTGVTSPTYRRNHTWTYTFTQPGTYTYTSSLNPTMTGVVVVS